MAKKNINIGQSVNDKTGDTLRSAFDKINQNFTELYNATGGGLDLLAVASNIVPDTDNTRTLGTPTKRWGHLYVGPGSISIGNAELTLEGGKIKSSTGFKLTDSQLDEVLPSQTGNAGKFLTTDGTHTLSWAAAAGGGVTSYTALTDKPTIPAAQIQSDWTQSSNVALDFIKNKPALFSGSYADLTNKPTIPAAQVQTDWNAVSGLGVVLNKPTLFSGSYTDLTNKPTIPTSFSSLVNSTKTVSLASTGVLSLPAQGLLTNVNQITSATINRTGASIDTAAIQEAWDIWYGNEVLWRTYLQEDYQPGFPPRPWFNKPSWEGYPLLMEYNSSSPGGGGGQLPPNPNLAPVGKTAIDSYLAYQELVSNIDILSGNKAFSFENTGELSLPGTLVFKDAANAKIVLKYTDQYGYVVEDTSLDKAWTFNANGSLTFPNATVQTTAFTGSVSSLVNSTKTVSLESTGNLTLPNAATIGRASDIEITTAETNYTNSLTTWASVRASYQAQADGLGITSTGWPFIAWNATGTTAAGFLSQLTTAWQIQQGAPTSPPTTLIFNPPISTTTYNELRTALVSVRDSYANWQALLTSVEITSGTESVTLLANGKLQVPNIIQTDVEEDLIIRTRYVGVTSPPAGSGQLSYANKDFVFSTNGSITFPRYDGSTVLNATVQGDSSGNLNLTGGNYVSIESNSYASVKILRNTANTSVDMGNSTSPVRAFGDLQMMSGRSMTTQSTTFNLINDTATTVNFAGAATTLNMGVAGGTTTIAGDLVVNGTTTTINSTTLTVDDKNIELGSVASPTDAGADGGGITLKGTTDKTFTYVNSTGLWTANIGVQATSFTGLAATAVTASTASSLGYLGMPQNAKSSSANTVIGDQGKHIYITGPTTITIDGSLDYPIGATIAFINSTSTATIAITTNTMVLGGVGTTGSRSLAPYGMATAVKVTATTWYINGVGLT